MLRTDYLPITCYAPSAYYVIAEPSSNLCTMMVFSTVQVAHLLSTWCNCLFSGRCVCTYCTTNFGAEVKWYILSGIYTLTAKYVHLLNHVLYEYLNQCIQQLLFTIAVPASMYLQ